MLTKFLLWSFLFIIFSADAQAKSLDSSSDFYYAGAMLGSDGHGIPVNVLAGFDKTLGFQTHSSLGFEASLYAIPKHESVCQIRGVGISILPGLWLTETTLGYLRAGMLLAESQSPHENHFGDQWGLGVQTQLIEHWQARGEYIYREYKSVHNRETTNTIDSNEVDIGLIFTF